MAYTVPDGAHLAAAAKRVYDLQETGTAGPEMGRTVAVLLASVVRDVLTDCDHAAPFDAAALELTAYSGTAATVAATGTYWTAAGEPRELTADDRAELNHWAYRLDHPGARSGWEPLCTVLSPGAVTRYRLDLARAAAALS
ncbi:hypothetical protein ACIRBY_37240 [Streptomyces sp. NPDC096136]|uniref:hypothetical protein n=1 Tax=Streptomyces sp. NPDC096136 TaxID=3366076 RepID=UPI0038233B92